MTEHGTDANPSIFERPGPPILDTFGLRTHHWPSETFLETAKQPNCPSFPLFFTRFRPALWSHTLPLSLVGIYSNKSLLCLVHPCLLLAGLTIAL